MGLDLAYHQYHNNFVAAAFGSCNSHWALKLVTLQVRCGRALVCVCLGVLVSWCLCVLVSGDLVSWWLVGSTDTPLCSFSVSHAV